MTLPDALVVEPVEGTLPGLAAIGVVTVASESCRWLERVHDRVLEPMNAPLRRVARRMMEVRPGSVVLDVGCGTGAALAGFREVGCRVLGADPSPAMLQQARARLGTDADLRLERDATIPFDDGCAVLVVPTCAAGVSRD